MLGDRELVNAPPAQRTRIVTVCDRSTHWIGSRCAPGAALSSGNVADASQRAFRLEWAGPAVYGLAIAPHSEVRGVRLFVGRGGAVPAVTSSTVIAGAEILVEGAPLRTMVRPGDVLLFDRLDGTDGLLAVTVALTPDAFDDLPLDVRARTVVVLGTDATVTTGYENSQDRWLDLDAHRGGGFAARSVVGRLIPETTNGGNVTLHGLIRSPRDGRVMYESAALLTVALGGSAGALISITETSLAGFDAARLKFPATVNGLKGEVTLL